MKTLKFLIPFALFINTFALVDYSDPAENEVSAPVQSKASTPKATSSAKVSSVRRNNGPKYIELNSSFSSHDVSYQSNKVESWNLQAKFETNYDIFLNLDHSFYSGKNTISNKSVSNESGNTRFILGVHWLEFGQASNALNLDLYAGASLKSKGEFATGRTDKIVGVETAKRFYNTAFAIGYEYTMTGTSDDKEETDIGNISTLFARLGVLVSNDIKFVLTAKNIAVASSDNQTNSNYLQKTIKYAYLKPELILSLTDSVGLTMGAVFRTRRPNAEQLSSNLKLWGQNGLYGNSIFAGLDFSI